MKIRFTTSICGQGWAFSYGDTLDVSETQGARLIKVGVAEPVASQPEVETATAPAGVVEHAVEKTTPKRKPATVRKAVQA